MFYIDLKHEGLGQFRRISGSDKYVVEQRAAAQQSAWDAQWQSQRQREQHQTARSAKLFSKEAKKAEAELRTKDAQDEIARVSRILPGGLHNAEVDFLSLKNRTNFADRKPSPPRREQAPTEPLLREPLKGDEGFAPKSSLWCWIFPGLKAKYQSEAESAFATAHGTWVSDSAAAHSEWSEKVRTLETSYSKSILSYEAQLAIWEKNKAEFEAVKAADNEKVAAFEIRYLSKDKDAVLDYIDLVLSRSNYPDYFPKQWQLALAPETGVLLVDYELPSVASLPVVKAVKYVQSKDVFEESYLREAELAQLYDGAMYQVCLRTIREILSSDKADAIKSVTFNGWVNFVDRSNGNPARACIMSLQVEKAAFLEINLTAVEPRACFRALKGVGSAKLAGMAAIAPILRFNKNDDRFVDARDVIDEMTETTNVAAIPWEDFEHLVRDVFEKEFSSTGGEVKITRASRDHGVDAIAFDPDPIRGGKIVIQAKRYTNVVGVAAVRDLYGTLINEGATKGILVTTSQYGSD